MKWFAALIRTKYINSLINVCLQLFSNVWCIVLFFTSNRWHFKSHTLLAHISIYRPVIHLLLVKHIHISLGLLIIQHLLPIILSCLLPHINKEYLFHVIIFDRLHFCRIKILETGSDLVLFVILHFLNVDDCKVHEKCF